ncbi:ATP-binding cassette domain-containing protein [Sinorhizobium medicae]|uniref:ABC transporter ATP-binding protein n=1 Tax=Sinorhizobium medicae TaxID=110321 RepID=UPI00129821A1|nr:ABC transporter ATP-binding protein [Sinorhizobium medicae]MQV98455.1 ATP-binding cassette domain-containing protein [Sinorhizobium medicae]
MSGAITAETPLLQVSGLTVRLRGLQDAAPIVDDFTLNLSRGESLGLAGESGCGKTTAALALMRLLSPGLELSSGSVQLGGVEILDLGEREFDNIRWLRVAYVFQGAMNAFNPVITIGDQIVEAICRDKSISHSRARQRCQELLESVGIEGSRADAFPHQFSGGMRQRAMIAMALAANPDVIIADEPTTALDVVVQGEILDLLNRLQMDRGLTTIMISHNLAAIASTCDKVAIMYAGRIVEIGSVEEVLGRPSHPYTRALTASAPRSDQDFRAIEPIPGAPPRPDELRAGCAFAQRCSFSREVCTIEQPELRLVKGISVACHLVEEL